MKKFTSTAATLIIALTMACVLSCSEQDEAPRANGAGTPDNAGFSTGNRKSSSSGRVGKTLFDGSEGDPIDLETARLWAANYRSKNPDDIRGHYFGFEIIQQILNESDCVGIRIYYAVDEQGAKKLLLVGVDAAGNNLLPSTGENMDGGGNTIADYSYPCPDYCEEDF